MTYHLQGPLPQVAHSQYALGTSTKEQVVFDLDAAAFSSDEFRMYNFKVSLWKHRSSIRQCCQQILTKHLGNAGQALPQGQAPRLDAMSLCTSWRKGKAQGSPEVPLQWDRMPRVPKGEACFIFSASAPNSHCYV